MRLWHGVTKVCEGGLAFLLRERVVVWSLAGAVLLYFGLSASGVYVHHCPLHRLTGLMCPGCGMTRAVFALGCGRMTAMWAAHPFALYFAVLALLILVVSFLGAGRRHLVADGILALERRTHAHAILLSSFVIFGILRLVILGLKH